jgi:hypothetical protein
MPGESCPGCAGVCQRAIGLQAVGTARAHRQGRAVQCGRKLTGHVPMTPLLVPDERNESIDGRVRSKLII